MAHVVKAEGAYRDELLEKIVAICSANQYAHISDFEWYLQVLGDLAHVPGTSHGSLLAAQLLDIMIRVKPIREVGMRALEALLADPALLHDSPGKDTRYEVLYAAAWCVGEYAELVAAPLAVLEALLQPRVLALPPHIQAVYLHNALKLLAHHAARPAPADQSPAAQAPQLDAMLAALQSRLAPFAASNHVEVQERACFALQLVAVLADARRAGAEAAVLGELLALFAEPLNPVAAGSQKKVPVPPELDLDTPLHPDALAEADAADAAVQDDPIWRSNAEPLSPAAPHAGPSPLSSASAPATARRAPPTTRTSCGATWFRCGRSWASRRTCRPSAPSRRRAAPAGPHRRPAGQEGKAKPLGNRAAALDLTTEAPPDAPAPHAKGPKRAAGAAAGASADPLAQIDLTSELRPHEMLPVRAHHQVAAPAPAKPAAAKAKKDKKPAELEEGQEEGQEGWQGQKEGRCRADQKEVSRRWRERSNRDQAQGREEHQDGCDECRRPSGRRRRRRRRRARRRTASGVRDGRGAERRVREVKVNAAEPSKVLVELTLRAAAPLSALAEQLAPQAAARTAHGNVRLARSQLPERLLPGAPATAHLLLQFDSYLQKPGRVPAVLAYTTATSEARRLDLVLPLPCSAFVQPIKLSRDQFATVLQSAGDLTLASALLAAPDQRAALVAAAAQLHLALVEAVPSAASLYGKSVAGHHVLALVNVQGTDTLRVDLKRRPSNPSPGSRSRALCPVCKEVAVFSDVQSTKEISQECGCQCDGMRS